MLKKNIITASQTGDGLSQSSLDWRWLLWPDTSPSLPSLPVVSSAWCQLTRGESGDQEHCLGHLQVQALLTLKLCLLLWHHAPSSISGRGRTPLGIFGRGRAPSGILGRGRAPMS